MENKYYTPDISEFHVGFKYEIYDGNHGQWNPRTINKAIDVNDVDFYIDDGFIRVKHLDKLDIESLGWECIRYDDEHYIMGEYKKPLLDDELNKGLYYTLRHSFSPVYDWQDNPIRWINTISITSCKEEETFEEKCNRFCFFSGEVKNKSELKKVLSQIFNDDYLFAKDDSKYAWSNCEKCNQKTLLINGESNHECRK